MKKQRKDKDLMKDIEKDIKLLKIFFTREFKKKSVIKNGLYRIETRIRADNSYNIHLIHRFKKKDKLMSYDLIKENSKITKQIRECNIDEIEEGEEDFQRKNRLIEEMVFIHKKGRILPKKDEIYYIKNGKKHINENLGDEEIKKQFEEEILNSKIVKTRYENTKDIINVYTPEEAEFELNYFHQKDNIKEELREKLNMG